MAKDIFLAFQGGGAKGIAHIGAYRVVWTLGRFGGRKTPRWNLAGVAGTSAGAIIAALVAAQVPPSTLFNAKKGTHLLQSVEGGKYESPKLLFTRWGWRRLWLARLMTTNLYVRGCIYASLLTEVAFLIWPLDSNPWIWIKIGTVLALLGICAILRHYAKGAAPLQEVRNLIDGLLADFVARSAASIDGATCKIGAGGASSRLQNVNFEQLAAAGGVPLKIVATNLTKRNVEVFSSSRTPGISVADAVCASICLPFVFRPFPIKMGMSDDYDYFVDGGALSNLPLWVFDEDRPNSLEAWTIGISMNPVDPPEPEISDSLKLWVPFFWTGSPWIRGLPGFDWIRDRAPTESRAESPAAPPVSKRPAGLGALIDTVVGGPLEIHARAVSDLLMIRLPVWLKVLDFDRSFSDYSKQIGAATYEAKRLLDNVEAASALEVLLGDLRKDLVTNILARQGGGGAAVVESHFRLAIFQARQRSRTLLWVGASIGYPLPREVLRARSIPIGSSLPGAASSSGDAQMADRQAVGRGARPSVSFDFETGIMADANWTLAVPLLNLLAPFHAATTPVQAVLSIDSPSLTEEDFARILGVDENALNEWVGLVIKTVDTFNQAVPTLGQFAEVLQLWH